MVIRRMNTVLVKHNKILFGVISIVIIVAFVWFFTPGVDGSLLFGNRMSSNAVIGTVFGKKITLKQYQKAFRDHLTVLGAMTGYYSGQLQEGLGKTLFETMAHEQAAELLGITVTDRELAKHLRGFAAFQGPKGYDPGRYKQFGARLREEGRTIADFEATARQFLAADKLFTTLTQEPVITPDELELDALLAAEKFHARTFEFPYAAYRTKVKTTDAEVRAFYDSNRKKFMTAPRIRADIVKFPCTVPETTPAELSIQAYYQAHKAEFTQDGKVQELSRVRPQIVHAIRVKTGKRLAREEARKFRDAIYTAAENSTGPATEQLKLLNRLAAENHYQVIHTAWFTPETKELKDIGAEPGLIAELFQTNPEHEPLLRSSYAGTSGVYVAGVAAFQPSVPADFKDVKSRAAELLTAQKARAMASEQANALFQQLAALPHPSAAQANAMAKKAGAKITVLKPFTRRDHAERWQLATAMRTASMLADQTVSRPADGIECVMLVFLDNREPPTAAEKAETLKMCQNLLPHLKERKQQAQLSTLFSWIRANTVNNLPKGGEGR